jgi:hypothetical protein
MGIVNIIFPVPRTVLHTGELHMACMNSNDLRLKSHYKMQRKILSNVIKEAKRNNYNRS